MDVGGSDGENGEVNELGRRRETEEMKKLADIGGWFPSTIATVYNRFCLLMGPFTIPLNGGGCAIVSLIVQVLFTTTSLGASAFEKVFSKVAGKWICAI